MCGTMLAIERAEHLWMYQKNTKGETKMGILRGGLAAAGAWKWGGGLISTILVFLLLYWLLGFFLK